MSGALGQCMLEKLAASFYGRCLRSQRSNQGSRVTQTTGDPLHSKCVGIRFNPATHHYSISGFLGAKSFFAERTPKFRERDSWASVHPHCTISVSVVVWVDAPELPVTVTV
jgi:hypothetical protein